MKDKKNIIFIIIGLVVLLIIVVILIFSGSNFENKLGNYLENIGYQKDIGTLYEKGENLFLNCKNSTDDCSQSVYYFDVSSYELIQNKYLRKDNVGFLFTPSYSYKTLKYLYKYRMDYQNGVLIFNGEYDINTKEYSCNLEYSYGIDIDNYKNSVCKDFKTDLDSFYYEMMNLITNTSMLNKMKK